MNKSKPIEPIDERKLDTKKILASLPDENNLPIRRSELRRLYKRMAKVLYDNFYTEAKLSTHTAKPAQDNIKEAERIILRNGCLSLIRTLKACVQLYNLNASLPPEER